MAIQAGGWLAGDETAVAHDDHLVRMAFDFIQLVRDIYDGDALFLEQRHQCKQSLRFGRCQRRAGLVHDQQTCLARQGFGNFNQLFFRNDQTADLGVRTDAQAHLGQVGRRFIAHGGIIQQPAFTLFVTQEDVLRYRQMLSQVEFLMDQDNPASLCLARTGELTALAINDQLAFGNAFVACQNLHQGGFAGAVFTQQTVHPAQLQIEADAMQHPHRAKILANIHEAHGSIHG